MADAQRVVEGIRNFLHSGHQTALESLKSMAQEYSEACQEVNRRLARCEEFLRQGLRSEAIHFAQAEPNLLDVLAVLDFPERQEWDQVVAHYTLTSPPVFAMETAAALNQAYAQVAPLDELLKKHRLLALARAPLGERLTVLKQIAQLDPSNPMWNQDILAFEQVRVRQMRAEVEQIKRQGGELPLSQLESLYNELQAGPWRVPVPADVAGLIEGMFHSTRDSQLRMRAEHLGRDMAVAHKSKNEFQARLLAQEWQQLTQQVNLPADDPSVMRASSVLQWLIKLDRQQASARAHQDAIDELMRALADPATPGEDLEDLYEGVAKSKGGVPAHIESVYRRRVRHEVVARTRRERIILATLFIVCASAFAGLVCYFVFLR